MCSCRLDTGEGVLYSLVSLVCIPSMKNQNQKPNYKTCAATLDIHLLKS